MDILRTLLPILVAVTILAVGLFFVCKKKKENDEKIQQMLRDKKAESERRKSCLHCNIRYNFEQDVSWEVLSEERRMTENSNILYKMISLKCTCPQCSEVKTYTEHFATEVMEKSGTKGRGVHKKYKYKLEDLIKAYFS